MEDISTHSVVKLYPALLSVSFAKKIIEKYEIYILIKTAQHIVIHKLFNTKLFNLKKAKKQTRFTVQLIKFLTKPMK